MTCNVNNKIGFKITITYRASNESAIYKRSNIRLNISFMSEDNQVLTMFPLVFVFVCLASMTVLGGTEKQLIKLEQGSLVLFHKVLALQIGNQNCPLFQLLIFSLN